jgi:hypothetical protein
MNANVFGNLDGGNVIFLIIVHNNKDVNVINSVKYSVNWRIKYVRN